MPPSKRPRYQYAALPFKAGSDGAPLILLITSRETRRWIIPRGRAEKGHKPWQVAAQEAYEEAGVIGMVSTKPIGGYQSVKRLASGIEVPCRVRVFPFDVSDELDDWPERSQRERQWLPVGEALAIVSEAGLADLLRQIIVPWPDGPKENPAD